MSRRERHTEWAYYYCVMNKADLFTSVVKNENRSRTRSCVGGERFNHHGPRVVLPVVNKSAPEWMQVVVAQGAEREFGWELFTSAPRKQGDLVVDRAKVGSEWLKRHSSDRIAAALCRK